MSPVDETRLAKIDGTRIDLQFSRLNGLELVLLKALVFPGRSHIIMPTPAKFTRWKNV